SRQRNASAPGSSSKRSSEPRAAEVLRPPTYVVSRWRPAGTGTTIARRFRAPEEIVMAKRIIVLAAAALLAAGCVSQKTYNESLDRNAQLEKEYQELNQSMSSEVSSRDVHIERLQDAIKVSVNSELLFPSGGWEMSESAKTSIAKVAKVLAPKQKA